MGWDQAPDTVARDITQICDRILQNHQPQGCLPKPSARDATTPVQTRLSARRNESAKKHAAPLRRAHETSPDGRPTKQERTGHGRYPLLASNSRRLLLFTRTACYFIFAAYRAGYRFSPACHAGPAAYHLPLVIRLAAKPSRWPGPAQAHVETESAIGNTAQHRLGVRVGYR